MEEKQSGRKQTKSAEKASPAESLYTVEELAGAHEEHFPCRAALVTAALKKAGKSLYTLAEAKKAVNDYGKTPVKQRKDRE